MTSSAQKAIIKNVCRLQGDSWRRLYENPNQYDKTSDEYMHSLNVVKKELGIDNLDIMETLSEITHEFDQLSVGDMELEQLDIHTFNIFKYILENMAYLWVNLYPNAHKSLTRRVKTIEVQNNGIIDLTDMGMQN